MSLLRAELARVCLAGHHTIRVRLASIESQPTTAALKALWSVMVAITKVIAGEESPYGLFHVTRTPLAKLREKGLRANALAEYSVHRLIERLQKRLAPVLEEVRSRCERTHQANYALELSLAEQLTIAPSHYSAILLALTQEDARLGMNDTSEPNRKARAMVEFARQFAPQAFERVTQMYKQDTNNALEALALVPDAPWHLLRLRSKPPFDDGFFALLAAPYLEVNGLMRSYDRGLDLRPEARAIWFNGVIPFDCLEVMPAPPAWTKC
ncbi:hypothetical protein PQQ72_15825 [Paraburkholderia strydomiana]|uniref:hypothetical protein n=1 Tax=Paraburkholderia strydomiana TaxID=1245417 RepID=UPI0038BC2DB2